MNYTPTAALVNKRIDLPRLFAAFEAACRAYPGGRMTPTGIGLRLGVTERTLHGMKYGKYRDVHCTKVLRLCAWMNVNPCEFLTDDTPN